MVSFTRILLMVFFHVSTLYKTSSDSSEFVDFFIKSGKFNVSLIVNSFSAKGLRQFEITFVSLTNYRTKF